jgi:hypothetical protein
MTLWMTLQCTIHRQLRCLQELSELSELSARVSSMHMLRHAVVRTAALVSEAYKFAPTSSFCQKFLSAVYGMQRNDYMSI